MVVTELIVVTLPTKKDMARRLASLPDAQHQDARNIIFDDISDHAGEQKSGPEVAEMIAIIFCGYVRTHPTTTLTAELSNRRPRWIDGSAVFRYLDVLVDD